MLAAVLVLALVGACEPARLGIAVFLVSGPRPLVNLRAFWLGGMVMATLSALIWLVFLRGIGLTVLHRATSLADSPTVKHIQLVVGVLGLLVAALMLRSLMRQRARVPIPDGGSSDLGQNPSTPTIFSKLSSRSRALEGGLPWLTFVIGLWLSLPPVEYAAALGVILASESAAATQIFAVVMFAIVSFVIFEIPLVSYLVTPAKSEESMLRLHTWMQARRQPILVIIIGAVGVLLLANGIGSI